MGRKLLNVAATCMALGMVSGIASIKLAVDYFTGEPERVSLICAVKGREGEATAYSGLASAGLLCVGAGAIYLDSRRERRREGNSLGPSAC